MGKANDLTEAERCIIVKEMAKGIPPKVIATSIGRHVDTMKRYLSNPSARKTRADAGVLKRGTDYNGRNIKRQLFINPGSTSKKKWNKEICTEFRNKRDASYSEVWQGSLRLKNYLP